MSILTQSLIGQDRAKLMAFAIQNDPMRMGEGAFVGLCTQNNVRIVRGGTGFAVSALTCNSIVAQFIRSNGSYYFINTADSKICQDFDQYAQAQVSQYQNKDIVLYLPDSLAAYFSMGANKSVGLGGAEHELGHILCDKANKMTPPNFFKHFIPAIRKFAQSLDAHDNLSYYMNSLSKFSNLFADIRLENMMPVMYPPTKQRFVDTQKCIFALEDVGLDQADPLSIIIVMMRDIGKNHVSPELTKRLKFYKTTFPQEWSLVQQKFMPLVLQNQCKTDDIDGTLHFPMLSAIEFLIEMKDMAKNPPELKEEPGDEPGDDSKPGKGKGKGKPQGGKGKGTDPDEDGEDSDGGGDKDDDEG